MLAFFTLFMLFTARPNHGALLHFSLEFGFLMLFDVAALKWPSSILVVGFALLKCKLQQRWIAPLLVAATSFAANLQSCSKLLTANLKYICSHVRSF
ncbi:hypothetical protein U1Q18_034732 [Sarracenia purpurea var. burkii]